MALSPRQPDNEKPRTLKRWLASFLDGLLDRLPAL
jgi:hypothetical protein